jgi:hypothetical protein
MALPRSGGQTAGSTRFGSTSVSQSRSSRRAPAARRAHRGPTPLAREGSRLRCRAEEEPGPCHPTAIRRPPWRCPGRPASWRSARDGCGERGERRRRSVHRGDRRDDASRPCVSVPVLSMHGTLTWARPSTAGSSRPALPLEPDTTTATQNSPRPAFGDPRRRTGDRLRRPRPWSHALVLAPEQQRTIRTMPM